MWYISDLWDLCYCELMMMMMLLMMRMKTMTSMMTIQNTFVCLILLHMLYLWHSSLVYQECHYQYWCFLYFCCIYTRHLIIKGDFVASLLLFRRRNLKTFEQLRWSNYAVCHMSSWLQHGRLFCSLMLNSTSVALVMTMLQLWWSAWRHKDHQRGCRPVLLLQSQSGGFLEIIPVLWGCSVVSTENLLVKSRCSGIMGNDTTVMWWDFVFKHRI